MRTRWLNIRSDQRGDTIIEVLIAITILSTVLFSAYALANQTAKLGLSAREQDQSTQLLQHQAEGLRHMRDNADNWNEFTDAVDEHNRFHTRINSGSDEWEIRNGKGNGEQVIDNSFSLFTTWAEVVSTGGDNNRRDITIHVEWETVNGKKQTSTTNVVLVNTDSLAPPSRLEPNVTCNDLDADPDSGTRPLHVDFAVDYDAEDTSVDHFEFDFGDGSGQVNDGDEDGADTAENTYTNSGSYTATVEIHPRDGETATCHTGVNVAAQSETFYYTGSIESYQVPAGVNEIRVDARGAQGGHTPGRPYGGGNGARVVTTISVVPGEKLYVYVGGKGGPPRNNPRASGGDGGWPNGGDGGDGGATTGSGAGGGGESRIRQPSNQYQRVVVAAGGGGSTRGSCSNGGNGGKVGEDGEDSHSSGGYGVAEGGDGATQGSGGDGGSGYGSGDGEDGRWVFGGDGGSTSGGGAGGGGGGYYGGGGGGSAPFSCAGGGGGGSSFTVGHNNHFVTGATSGHGRIKITPL